MWNEGLVSEIKMDFFGWYYNLNKTKRKEPENIEKIEWHINGVSETYVILKKTQGRWKPEWDERCKYSKIKATYRLVVD